MSVASIVGRVRALALTVTIALVAVASVVAYQPADAGAQSAVSGSYQLITHVQAGVTVVTALTLSVSGGRLSGSDVGNDHYSVSGTIGKGRAPAGFVNVKFDAFGPNGYIAHYTGIAKCDGSFMNGVGSNGGWSDTGGERGSWQANRQGGPSGGSAGCGGLSIDTNSLPKGKAGEEYRATLKGSGGRKPYHWAASGLPKGLRLDGSSGTISGKPEKVGGSQARVTLSDRRGDRTSRTFGLTIDCPSSGTGTSGAAKACALTVKIDVLESIRSGLAIHRHPYQFYPVDFRAPKNSTTLVCESGCADVIVSVTDEQTHKTVPGATVKATLGAIAHVVTGGQLLCGPTGPCGTAISGQTTDGKGQLLLTYWAPGVIEPTSVKLRVTATCTPTACPVKKKTGIGKKTLAVKPYLIYQHAGALTAQQANTVAKWAEGPGAFTDFLKRTHYAEVTVETSAKFLEGLEVSAESLTKTLAAIEVVEPIVGPVLAAHELYHLYTELSERKEMLALFLELNDLNPAGIGGVPFAAFGSPIPSVLFQNYIANAGTFLPLNIGAGGLLWRYAQTLDFLKKHRDHAFGSQSTELKVYEVSHCDPDKGSCGPGYGNVIGSGTVVNPGIQPELYFEFSAQHHGFAHSFPPTSFTIPYDAVA